MILAGIADQILHWLGVFPPWGQITYEPVPYVLAVTYRAVFGVAGGYITARLAARAPMRHALALGVVGLVFCLAGVVAAVVSDPRPGGTPVLSIAMRQRGVAGERARGSVYAVAGSVAGGRFTNSLLPFLTAKSRSRLLHQPEGGGEVS